MTQWTVNVWFTGRDQDEIWRYARCCREAAKTNEVSTGARPGPPLYMDMQFRCFTQKEAQTLLDRMLLACTWVKGEILKEESP